MITYSAFIHSFTFPEQFCPGRRTDAEEPEMSLPGLADEACGAGPYGEAVGVHVLSLHCWAAESPESLLIAA